MMTNILLRQMGNSEWQHGATDTAKCQQNGNSRRPFIVVLVDFGDKVVCYFDDGVVDQFALLEHGGQLRGEHSVTV